MRERVLNDLYRQGELTFFAFSNKSRIPLKELRELALALNAGANFVLIDFSGKSAFYSDTFTNNLISQHIDVKTFTNLQNTQGCIIASTRTFPKTDTEFRILYHNVQSLKKISSHILAILPSDLTKEESKYAPLLSRLLIIESSDTHSVDECATMLEDFENLRKLSVIWLVPQMPNKKKFPKAVSCIQKLSENFLAANYKDSPTEFAHIIEDAHKIAILKMNPLDGSSKVFKKAYPLLLLLTIMLPFMYITKTEQSMSNMRNRIHERNNLSVAPSFEYTFNGNIPMQRIARYAIGRFNATVTNEKMVRTYINETLEENGYLYAKWERDKMIYPPQGTTIKFLRPDYLSNEASDSIGSAWKYWTSIVSDSIAYITELYNPKQTKNSRLHNGIDLASSKGARILAPFAAKVWTSRDERGGIIIGLVRKKDVILFMHCDQLLYLNGQEVMAGDPIATVGLTGHTTGPHAHIVTGIIDKNGDKHIGNIRYKILDPMQWFYMFKQEQ